jgi:hypothetical protein
VSLLLAFCEQLIAALLLFSYQQLCTLLYSNSHDSTLTRMNKMFCCETRHELLYNTEFSFTMSTEFSFLHKAYASSRPRWQVGIALG